MPVDIKDDDTAVADQLIQDGSASKTQNFVANSGSLLIMDQLQKQSEENNKDSNAVSLED